MHPGKRPYNSPSGLGQVKREDGGDVKKLRLGGPSGSHGMFNHARTAAASMVGYLKGVNTLGWQDAWFHIQHEHPGHNPQEVLGILKGLERVSFNEVNQVFTYVPELSISNEAQLRSYIRTHSTPTTGVQVKDIREALPPNGLLMLEALEQRGDVLIMRALTGSFRDAPIPKLGQPNVQGLKINDPGTSGLQRLKSVWWDDVRERGRAGKRVEDEIIFAWDDVTIAETDDVIKLLERENLGASSAMPPPPKIGASAPVKKKAARRRPLKITNTHMKAQGIDFSQDYVQE